MMGVSKEIASAYYPPRARWYGPVLRGWFEVRRALHLEKIHPGIRPRDMLLGLLIPGHAFSAYGMRVVARTIQIAFLVEALVFLAALGYAPGNIAFGLMISAHATSILYLAGRLSAATRLPMKVAFAVMTLFVLTELIYLPLRGSLEKHFVPLRIGDQVVVIRRMAPPKRLQRGDVVAYSFSEVAGDHVRAQAGVGFEPVLALGGDTVRFHPQALEINGALQPRRLDMPVSGELAVPEKHWFIWPRFVISNGQVPANVPGLLLQLATVSETQYLGQPYRYWFGRRQKFAPEP